MGRTVKQGEEKMESSCHVRRPTVERYLLSLVFLVKPDFVPDGDGGGVM